MNRHLPREDIQMGSKHMKRHSTCTPTNRQNPPKWQQQMLMRMWNNANSHSLLVGMKKMVQPLQKTVWQFLTKLNIFLPYNPAISLLIYPKELKTYIYTKIAYECLFFIHHRQKLGAIKMWLASFHRHYTTLITGLKLTLIHLSLWQRH